MSHLKKFILENLLTVKNKFNNRTTSEKWWTIRNHMSIYNQILDITQFLPENVLMTRRAFHIVNELYEVEKCVHCLEKDRIFINYTEGYSYFCSRKCSIKSEMRTQKIQSTNIEKYGSTCTLQNKEIKNKLISANLERYGVEYYTQTDEMITKTKNSKFERYDDSRYNNMEKNNKTCLDRYGYNYVTQVPDIILKMQDSKGLIIPELRDKSWLVEQNKTKNIQSIAEELNVTYRTVWLWMNKHEIEFKTHETLEYKEQKGISDFIKNELNIVNVKDNDRTIIYPKEIDVYLPDYNLGIELNGMYWHREDKIRHLEKLNLCKDKNIKLIQFWDYEWTFKQDICKSIIKCNLGLNEKIYARKCKIIELSYSDYQDFMNDNHLQGSAMASIRYGLEYDNEIVCCISFSKPRDKSNKENYEWELVRYANKLNINVIGGFSRLFKHANLDNIISYCDIMRFSGNLYSKNGFDYLKTTAPGYFYFRHLNIRSREHFQKHKLYKNLSNYDPLLSAKENIKNNGWSKVYNCGNSVWIYKK